MRTILTPKALPYPVLLLALAVGPADAADPPTTPGPAGGDEIASYVAKLTHADANVREAAIDALSRLGVPAADYADRLGDRVVGELQKILQSSDQRAQPWAAEALARMGPVARKAKQSLVKLLRNGSADSRRRAAVALGAVCRADDASDEVIEALTERLAKPDEDPEVLQAAID